MPDEMTNPPNRGLSDLRARQSASEILRELYERVGHPDQPIREGRLPSAEETPLAYDSHTPELEAIYHDTLGLLLRAIADGQIPPGQPRIASNRYRL